MSGFGSYGLFDEELEARHSHIESHVKPSPVYKCPCCEYEGMMVAQDKQFEHACFTGKKVTGLWYYYSCPNCEITFYTEESDTLSMKRWNQ